jgi:DGQHR domain-containing protein
MTNYLTDRTIKCLPVLQNQQDFLVGIFSIGTILKFTKYTTRLIVGFDANNVPEYNPEIQRKLENSRVQKIADFLIEDPNATFPTNIVLHIPSLIMDKQERKEGFVEIELSDKVFEGVEKSKQKDDAGHVYITIIDGQHRLKGIETALERITIELHNINQTLIKSPEKADLKAKLEQLSKRKADLLNIQLVVSFFVDKTLEYQAMIFSTINRTQKRVSDSLVSSLFGLNSGDSPQKTSLQIVLALNGHLKSPFFNRINLYGNSYQKGQSPPLSQATMVKSILTLICENDREAERDRFRRRRELLKRSISSNKDLPFRFYYATNNDKKISDILFTYFNAVRKTFVDEQGHHFWDFNPESMKPTNVLQTAVGYFALLNLLVDILKELTESEKVNSEKYESYLEKTKKIINVQDLKRYPLTSKSRTILYLDLNLAVWPAKNIQDPRILRLNELLVEN